MFADVNIIDIIVEHDAYKCAYVLFADVTFIYYIQSHEIQENIVEI